MSSVARKKSGFDEDDDEDDDVFEGSFFYINRDGFPITEETWDRMYDFAAKNHPLGNLLHKEVKERVKRSPDVPIPHPPGAFSSSLGVAARIEQVQNYISSLKYNHTGTQFFEIKKARPIAGLMEIAKEMIKESLPIKCLEALVLATYLTNDIHGLLRFNISFKTIFEGGLFRHVVLGVYSNGKYGALGMSRRKDLMYKPLKFDSLTSLVKNFLACYKKYGHTVRKLKVGNKITKDPHSFEPIPWKGISLELGKLKDGELCRELERHSRDLRVVSPYDTSPRIPTQLPATTTTTTTRRDSLTNSLSILNRDKVDKSFSSPPLGRRSRSFVASSSDLRRSREKQKSNGDLRRSRTSFLNSDDDDDSAGFTKATKNGTKNKNSKISASVSNVCAVYSEKSSYKVRV